jgi:hypothetical protein
VENPRRFRSRTTNRPSAETIDIEMVEVPVAGGTGRTPTLTLVEAIESLPDIEPHESLPDPWRPRRNPRPLRNPTT